MDVGDRSQVHAGTSRGKRNVPRDRNAHERRDKLNALRNRNEAELSGRDDDGGRRAKEDQSVPHVPPYGRSSHVGERD